eukprot:2489191-Pleurochrysis_carterae.AAC.3
MIVHVVHLLDGAREPRVIAVLVVGAAAQRELRQRRRARARLAQRGVGREQVDDLSEEQAAVLALGDALALGACGGLGVGGGRRHVAVVGHEQRRERVLVNRLATDGRHADLQTGAEQLVEEEEAETVLRAVERLRATTGPGPGAPLG